MVYNNKVKPISDQTSSWDIAYNSSSSLVASGGTPENSTASSKDFNDFERISNVHLEESSYLKLKPFSRLDPTLVRLLRFLGCFGLTMNSKPEISTISSSGEKRLNKGHDNEPNGGGNGGGGRKYSRYLKVAVTLFVAIITSEVVYDVNLRQSKLLAEQKRSTPLLTFVIVAYYWLTLVIPLTCDISLIFIGPYLFRFYSRTTATVCNGMFFGKKTSVDTWYYYLGLVLIAFLDVMGQVVLLGVWPESIDPYMRMIVSSQNSKSIATETMAYPPTGGGGSRGIGVGSFNQTTSADSNFKSTGFSTMLVNNVTSMHDIMANSTDDTANSLLLESSLPSATTKNGPRITTYLLDFILGETYAHGDLGVCIKIICLMIQFMHSYAFLIIIISLADHYATAINNINDNLDKYEFRRLLKQLIILRDSSEQISLMISIPFSLIILLVFMRQIALNGVFIQSTMQPYENWAVSLQSFTCSVSIFMVFIYCDGLQSASKQTHRLKTEQTVINENRGGNQSIYEFLDYLDRLSKSIRITFFNIIAINKSSLVGLFGHILTLTFVTS